MAIDIDSTAYTATLSQEFYHPQGVLSGSQGSIEPLSNGNHLVGWGANPTFTEHLPDGLDGTTVLDVQFKPWRAGSGSGGSSYRVFKLDWAGFPLQPPSVAVEGNGTANATVYVSWNGATEARRWALVSQVEYRRSFNRRSWLTLSPSSTRDHRRRSWPRPKFTRKMVSRLRSRLMAMRPLPRSMR